MKSKKFKKIRNLIFLLLSIVIYVLLTYKSAILIMPLGIRPFFYLFVFVMLAGIIDAIIKNSILHEIGHTIFGLIAGLKLISVKILFFKFNFEKGFNIKLEKANNLGETVFIPKKYKNISSKVAFSILGGLLATICLLIKSIYAYKVFSPSFELSYGIEYVVAVIKVFNAGSIVVAIYVLLTNIFGEETCDGRQLGRLLFANKNKRIISSNALYIGCLLYNGVNPTQIDHKYLSVYNEDYSFYSTLIIYYRYLSLISVNEEYALKEILKISDINKLKDVVFDTIMCELYFVAYLNNDKIFLNNNKEYIENIVEYDNNLYALRAHAVLRIVNNELDWANILINQGLEQTTNVCYGLNAVENPLFKRLYNSINQ